MCVCVVKEQKVGAASSSSIDGSKKQVQFVCCIYVRPLAAGVAAAPLFFGALRPRAPGEKVIGKSRVDAGDSRLAFGAAMAPEKSKGGACRARRRSWGVEKQGGVQGIGGGQTRARCVCSACVRHAGAQKRDSCRWHESACEIGRCTQQTRTHAPLLCHKCR